MTNDQVPNTQWGVNSFGHKVIRHSMFARSSEMNPQFLCAPSQKGFFADWPQRQRAIPGLSVLSENVLPAESTSVNGPSITRGPLDRMRIRTSDISDGPLYLAATLASRELQRGASSAAKLLFLGRGVFAGMQQE